MQVHVEILSSYKNSKRICVFAYGPFRPWNIKKLFYVQIKSVANAFSLELQHLVALQRVEIRILKSGLCVFLRKLVKSRTLLGRRLKSLCIVSSRSTAQKALLRKRNRIRYVNKISHVFTRKYLKLT